ncbi:MAG: Alpha/Beta hydrolase protein [Linnemannia gamsii]|nr:MAG: Alpha/Beta hydrolase protein [Linnemannia gamsii]
MTASDTTINITLPNYGTIRGSVDTKRQVAVFKNVPYAHAPERWRVAVKPQPWTGVRDATVQGPSCPQGPSLYPLGKIVPESMLKVGTHPNPAYAFGVEHSERDGLNLNIFVPLSALAEDGVVTAQVPVMTWIHGGAFRNGANCIPLYDARNFVEHSIKLNQPVIVVAVNYRLAAYGFLASKELQQDMDEYARSSTTSISPYDQSVGNWGLQDQKLAFEWVRENISALGGNSRNVTAWGESAGSLSLHYHMLIPAHRGLFDHAILQSGVVSTMAAATVQDSQVIFDKLVETLGIPSDLDGVEKVKRLRAVPMDELTAASDIAGPGLNYVPHHDGGKLMPSSTPIQAWSAQISSYDPSVKSIMIGTNKDEGTAFAAAFGTPKLASHSELVKKFAPSPQLIPLFESVYGTPESDQDAAKILAAVVGDLVFQYPAQQIVDILIQLQNSRSGSDNSLTLVRYHYDVALTKMEEIVPGLGAMHAGELPIIFGPPFSDTVLTESELAFSTEIQKRWIAFANQRPVTDANGKEADPAKDEAIVWTHDHHVEVGKGRRLSKEAMAFWETITKFKLQHVQQALTPREE